MASRAAMLLPLAKAWRMFAPTSFMAARLSASVIGVAAMPQ